MPQKKKASKDSLAELGSRVAKSPTKPGIYKWIGKNEEVLYVGKAKNLKNRLKNYVQKKQDVNIGPWKQALIKNIVDVDWTVTSTELEALILETNLIKDLKPKYNVLMKDDKNYVYVRISLQDAYPRVDVVRRMEEDGAKYFGPFTSASYLKKTLDMLHEVYAFQACKRSLDILNKNKSTNTSTTPLRHPERSANTERVRRNERVEVEARSRRTSQDAQKDTNLKPCLDSQIGRCNGLCQQKLTQEEYRKRIEDMMQFFKNDRKDVIKRLQERMQQAAEQKRFEDATQLRDTLKYIQSLEEQQIVSDTSGANTDVFGIALLGEKAHVVVLRERDGKLVGERSYALVGIAETAGEALAQFIPQYYIATDEIPDTILCAELADEEGVLETWLNERRTGRRVSIHIPERGKKSKLLKMAEENAEEKIKQHLAKWESATKKVEDALIELKKVLDLPEKPKRIECYDISHLAGTETVGSMVVAHHGKMKNADYRSFTIRTMKKGEIDDYKALKEVLSRRLRHLQNDLKKEARILKENGITCSKAKKNEADSIKEYIEHEDEEMSLEDFDYQDYIVARTEENIIAFGRLLKHVKNEVELKNIWIHPSQRSKGLGLFIIRTLLNKAKKQKEKKVYIRIHPTMEEYYAQIGFRHILALPPVLEKKVKEIRKKNPDVEGMTMMYEFAKNKIDSSLSTTPDLLVLDGGKGQLSTGVEVLKKMNLTIPIIGLAKREEEVFEPENSTPVAFKKDSEGLFLLMRLRDEAHRFANRHREKRANRTLLG